MPSILSKFTKADVEKGGSVHRRAHTTSESRSSTPSTSAQSNPRLVLTNESNESLEHFPTGDGPREDSLLTPTANPTSRGQSLYPDYEEGKARKAFAEKMREGGRRALSVGAPPTQDGPNDDDLTPGPLRPSPAPPTRAVPPVPELPQRSQTEVSRSRHNSTTSAKSQRDPPPPVPPITMTPQQRDQQPLVASPTSETHSPPQTPPAPAMAKGDLKRNSSEKKKSNTGWTRRSSLSSNKSPPRRIHPSGGLASAIAGSGLALANPAVQRPLLPTVNPIAATRHRQNSSVSELGLGGGRDRHAQSRKSSMSQNHRDDAPHGAAGSLEEAPFDNDSASSGSASENESSGDDVDVLADGITPITGFAVASNKRTADFHALFPSVPEGDYLIDDYGCALQREILIQGRLYISENHVCFHANIFGWTTDLVIPIEDVTQVEKRMTAYVIPNALQICTYNAKYTFASLLSRDTTYDVIYNIWRSVRPDGAPSPRGSLEDDSIGASMGSVTEGLSPPNGIKNKVTQCACSREGKHLSEIAMDAIIPGEPEKIYNLIFASGWIKEFMRDDQKLQDIQISDWIPISATSKLLKRNMSYIKPLSGSIGPKQTKCELQDEMVHLDISEYITMMTTTRTPDVPSGGVFAVKTRTCLMWGGLASTRIIVSTQVEWTGRSFIKGIIEKSCIDGQKAYHVDLERSLRSHIAKHKSEFVPQGLDVEEMIAVTPVPPTPGPTADEDRKAKERERNQRGLQWALDTVEGTMKVARQSFWGAIDLIKDTWDASETTAVLWFVVVILFLSNIYTWFRGGRVAEGPRRKGVMRDYGLAGGEEIDKVVGQSVREAFKAFEEVVRTEGTVALGGMGEIRRRLEGIEARVMRLEGMIAGHDGKPESMDTLD